MRMVEARRATIAAIAREADAPPEQIRRLIRERRITAIGRAGNALVYADVDAELLLNEVQTRRSCPGQTVTT